MGAVNISGKGVQLVGWDCAVDAKKCGIAFGEVTAKGLEVESVETGLSEKALIGAIVERITSKRSLFAGY